MIEVINQKEILLRVYKYPYKSVFNRLKEHCLSYRYNHYKEIFYLLDDRLHEDSKNLSEFLAELDKERIKFTLKFIITKKIINR